MLEVKITATSAEDLAQQLVALTAALTAEAAPVEAAPVVDKPKPRATPAKKADPAPEPEATVAVKAEPKLLDFNSEVAPKVVAAVEEHGKELVASVLVQYGVARASEMPPERWPEFLVSLEDAISSRAVV